MNWHLFKEQNSHLSVDEAYQQFRALEENAIYESASKMAIGGHGGPVEVKEHAFFSHDHTQTFTDLGYTLSANVIANSVITVKENGTEITAPAIDDGSYNIMKNSFESAYADTTFRLVAQVKTEPTVNSILGLRFNSATNGYGADQGSFKIYLNTGIVWHKIQGTTYINNVKIKNWKCDVNDVISLSFRRYNDVFRFTIWNKTKSIVFNYEVKTSADNAYFMLNQYAGFVVAGGTYLIKQTKYFTQTIKPQVLVVGDSIAQGYKRAQFHQTPSGLMSEYMGKPWMSQAKASNSSLDMLVSMQHEIGVIKPKHVLIWAGHNDPLFSIPAATTQANIQAMVELALIHGAKVHVAKIPPSSWIDTSVTNTWVDLTYGFSNIVNVVNLFDTTDLYLAGAGASRNTKYYTDLAHLNLAGNYEIFNYLKKIAHKFK